MKALSPRSIRCAEFLSIDDYKKILKMFRTGQPFIHDPFEERDVKVIFASLEYEGSTEKFVFELIEDVI